MFVKKHVFPAPLLLFIAGAAIQRSLEPNLTRESRRYSRTSSRSAGTARMNIHSRVGHSGRHIHPARPLTSACNAPAELLLGPLIARSTAEEHT